MHLLELQHFSLTTWVIVVGLTFFSYLISVSIYNLHFHPLAKFPGPKLWALSRLPFVRAMQAGTLVHQINKFHAHHGRVVRVAPNELSFIDPVACRDIYAARPGQPEFPKNPIWMGDPIPRGNSIVDASDEDHARMRKVWSYNFTEKSLKQQEPLLQLYVGKFVERLRVHGKDAVVDIVQWFNFLTVDLTGDLAFGQSFECLEGRVLHPWIEMIFGHLKSATLLASIRFYPLLYGALLLSLPASVLKKQRDHSQMATEKVQRRLNSEQERPDFLQHIVEHNHGCNGNGSDLSEAEIEKTAATMIIAGSETTATLLSGIMNHLIKNSKVMDELAHEIRASYSSEEQMSLASLARLPYLGAVIQEGLRIAPPVPTGMPRVVPIGGARVCGHWLPANTFVSYAHFAAYHSRLNFSSPDTFLPSRWLSSTNDNTDALQPFSIGSRNCIGQRLAWAETRLVLARLFWNFDVESVEEKKLVEWAEQKAYTVWEKEEGWVRLRHRNLFAGN